MRIDEKQKEIYIQAVDKTLKDLLGRTAAQIIYMYLEKRCKIKKEEIPFKKGKFINQLQQIFGNTTKIIETKIGKEYIKLKTYENHIK